MLLLDHCSIQHPIASLFFSKRIAMKMNFHNSLFDGRTKATVTSSERTDTMSWLLPYGLWYFCPRGNQYTQVFLLPVLRSAALAVEGWSLNLNRLQDWMQTLNLASNACSSAVGIDATLIRLASPLLESTNWDEVDLSDSLDAAKKRLLLKSNRLGRWNCFRSSYFPLFLFLLSLQICKPVYLEGKTKS